MNRDLTKGSVLKSMLLFSIPMILGDLLQQCYNIVDTLIVGQFLGKNALASVGSSFTLMTFITSIILGLCMGSGALFSIRYGQKDKKGLREDVCASFFFIALITFILTVISYIFLNQLSVFLHVPHEVWGDMKGYLIVIFIGIPAIATVISQYLSGIGISIYSLIKNIQVRAIMKLQYFHLKRVHKVISFSVLTCIQQSVMNLGILMVQGLVNSFGTVVMAAFAAAVKIDAFAYMPVQDFGNAFSTFIAQNYGAKEKMRIQSGLKSAVCLSMGFCIIISTIVCIFAKDLMTIFIDAKETEIIMEGVKYLKIEGAFYCGIGCLFLLYGLYRALGKPGMSVVLTIFSLGTRVVLAYILSAIPAIGVTGIWWSVPIGWALADLIGLIYYRCKKKELLSFNI